MEKTKYIFDSWNCEKQQIDLKGRFKRIKVGEIWLCKIGVNIGGEISKDGKFSRPVLVVSNKLGGDLVGVLPLTTVYNENYDNFLLEMKDFEKYGLNNKSYLVLNQFKIISLKRLERKFNGLLKNNTFLPLVPINKINIYLDKYFTIIKKEPLVE